MFLDSTRRILARAQIPLGRVIVGEMGGPATQSQYCCVAAGGGGATAVLVVVDAAATSSSCSSCRASFEFGDFVTY